MNNKRTKQNKISQMKARFFAGFSCAAYGFAVLTAIVSSNLPRNSVWKEAFGSIVEIGLLAGVLLTFIWRLRAFIQLSDDLCYEWAYFCLVILIICFCRKKALTSKESIMELGIAHCEGA